MFCPIINSFCIRFYPITYIHVAVGFFHSGEYVIMVQDVTSPPFMGYNLEPAFLLVKVSAPKKVKKKPEKKDKGPRYETRSLLFILLEIILFV